MRPVDVRYCVTNLVRSLPRQFAAAAFVLLALAYPAAAADVTVVWDPNPEPDIAGYIVSYGTAPGAKTVMLDGARRTSQVITGLTVGTKYYFRVEAYNSSGMKSVPSQELPYTVAAKASSDTVSPVVTSGSPAPNATGVTVSSTVRVVFSEPMNAATITSTTVALLKGTTAVATAVTYDATTKTATITPTTALAASTKYTVRVLGGTADPRPKDLAGNALVSTTSWSFTTGTAGAAAPPKPTITSPTTGLLFRGGQVLTYAGTATDPNETLAASAYTWTVTRYDGTTPTVAQGPVTGVTSGSFTVPTTGKAFTATTYYEIKLTVKDKTGLSASTTVQVKPRMANLSLASSPSGLQLSIDGAAQAAPFTRQTLSGFKHTLGAPSPQQLSTKKYAFDRWSNAGAATHTVTVPDAGLSLTASFAQAAASGPTTSTFRVTTGADDVNEVSGVLDAAGAAWLGTGGSATASFSGLRFAGVAIPQGAQIVSARLEVQARVSIFTPLGFEFGIQNVGNAAAFTSTSRPSQRTLATPRVAHSSNTSWTAGQWYALNDIAPLVQAVVSRTDWQNGNGLALVMRGTYGTSSRMFIGSARAGRGIDRQARGDVEPGVHESTALRQRHDHAPDQGERRRREPGGRDVVDHRVDLARKRGVDLGELHRAALHEREPPGRSGHRFGAARGERYRDELDCDVDGDCGRGVGQRRVVQFHVVAGGAGAHLRARLPLVEHAVDGGLVVPRRGRAGAGRGGRRPWRLAAGQQPGARAQGDGQRARSQDGAQLRQQPGERAAVGDYVQVTPGGRVGRSRAAAGAASGNRRRGLRSGASRPSHGDAACSITTSLTGS